MVDDSKTRNPGHSLFGLNEPSQASPDVEAPSSAPPATQPVYLERPPAPSPWSFSGGQVLILLVVVLLIISGVNLYLIVNARSQMEKHADELNLLTRRLDAADERYAQLSGKFQVMTGRLGLTQAELARARSVAADIQKQQEAAVQQLNEAIAKKATADELSKVQTDANAKIGNLSGDLAGTKKDLEDTKQALLGTKGELTGAIARTHDELVELAHRSDRDYFEFSLSRKRAQQKVGGVTITLEKTNPKRNQFTVTLLFDDKAHPYKDRTINEPLPFYVSGAQSHLELVVNKLGKDSVAGYLSTPKGLFANTPNVLSSRPGA